MAEKSLPVLANGCKYVYCGDMSTIEFNDVMADLLLSDVAKEIIGGAMEGMTDGEQ